MPCTQKHNLLISSKHFEKKIILSTSISSTSILYINYIKWLIWFDGGVWRQVVWCGSLAIFGVKNKISNWKFFLLTSISSLVVVPPPKTSNYLNFLKTFARLCSFFAITIANFREKIAISLSHIEFKAWSSKNTRLLFEQYWKG